MARVEGDPHRVHHLPETGLLPGKQQAICRNLYLLRDVRPADGHHDIRDVRVQEWLAPEESQDPHAIAPGQSGQVRLEGIGPNDMLRYHRGQMRAGTTPEIAVLDDVDFAGSIEYSPAYESVPVAHSNRPLYHSGPTLQRSHPPGNGSISLAPARREAPLFEEVRDLSAKIPAWVTRRAAIRYPTSLTGRQGRGRGRCRQAPT